MTREATADRSRISQHPDVMVGKPVVAGTRIPVDLVLGYLAHSLDLNALFASYPELTVDDVKAVLEYARAAVGRERATAESRRAPSSGPLLSSNDSRAAYARVSPN